MAKQPKFTDEIPGTEFNSAREFLPPSRCGLVSNKVDAASNEIFRYDENLLVTNWVAEAWKSEFVYDARFRRRIERDYGWSGGSWTLTNETRFIYDGNVVIQHRAANNLPSQILTRGTDLSGTFQVAGGIGAWNSTRRPMHQSCHEILRWRGFSAYEPARARKARTTPTKHPTRLPASYGCPGSPSVALEFFTLTTQIVFGRGMRLPSYVGASE